MSFPYHDRNWKDVADHLEDQVLNGETLLAPDDFWRVFTKINRYLNTHLHPEQDYDWAILHKGRLDEIGRSSLKRIGEAMRPVLANEVFVVWAKRSSLARVDESSPHLASYYEIVNSLPAASHHQLSEEPVLPDAGEIVQFAKLDAPAFELAMDGFWRSGGYVYETLRDQVYYREIDRIVAELAGDVTGFAVLDNCCGIGRFQNLFKAASVTGIDISGAAIEMARQRHLGQDNFVFQKADAHSLDFPNESFDLVTFIDAIEHVWNAERVFAECSRVLKPGGRMILTAANTNGLNQIVTRKLGYKTFNTNYQHIREFSFEEVTGMLAEVGFRVTASSGLFLYPYWGVPGIDEQMRPLTDWDPEIVELMRDLGERVGPQYAYSFIVSARKE